MKLNPVGRIDLTIYESQNQLKINQNTLARLCLSLVHMVCFGLFWPVTYCYQSHDLKRRLL